MKFRCERDALVEALGSAARIATTPGAGMPILSGVHLDLRGDALTVTGTDQDLRVSVAAQVTGLEDGVAVPPSRLVSDIVRALDPGAVTVETGDAASGDEAVRITSGRSAFSVRAHPPADFPPPRPAGQEAVTLPAEGLSEALRQVVRAASRAEERPILTGVLMAAESGGLRLVATDSYRLAVRDLPGAGVLSEGQKVLVPSRVLAELQRMLGSPGGGEVQLRLGHHDVTFETGPISLTSRLIEGEFPNYRQLIPDAYPNRLVVGREPLLDAVRRVKLMARDPTTAVRVALRPDGVELTVITTDQGTATEDVDAKYEGAEMTVAFNPAYLIEGVEAIPTDEVVLDTTDALKPATLRPTGSDEFLYLLMPVRVS